MRLRRSSSTNAWQERAASLAQWVRDHMINRDDQWAAFVSPRRQRKGTLAEVVTGELDEERFIRHFQATEPSSLIGLHASSASRTSRWVAIDIGRHQQDDPTRPGDRFQAALLWYDRLRALEFDPLLLEADSTGRYILLTLFDFPVPTGRAHVFVQDIISDWADHDLREAPVVLPDETCIHTEGLDNWLRLPGRHPYENHYTRVWDGYKWVGNEQAIELLLACTATSAARLRTSTVAAAVRGKALPSIINDDGDAGDALDALSEVEQAAEELERELVGMTLSSGEPDPADEEPANQPTPDEAVSVATADALGAEEAAADVGETVSVLGAADTAEEACDEITLAARDEDGDLDGSLDEAGGEDQEEVLMLDQIPEAAVDDEPETDSVPPEAPLTAPEATGVVTEDEAAPEDEEPVLAEFALDETSMASLETASEAPAAAGQTAIEAEANEDTEAELSAPLALPALNGDTRAGVATAGVRLALHEQTQRAAAAALRARPKSHTLQLTTEQQRLLRQIASDGSLSESAALLRVLGWVARQPASARDAILAAE